MESIRELQRQGKNVNVALCECETGDIVALHHDKRNVSNYNAGDVLKVGDRWCTRVSDGSEQMLMYDARVYIMERKREIVKIEECRIGDIVEILVEDEYHDFKVGDIATVESNRQHDVPYCKKEDFYQYVKRETKVNRIEKGKRGIVKIGECEVGDVIEILVEDEYHDFKVGDIVTVESNRQHNIPYCKKENLGQYIERETKVHRIEKGNE